MMCPDNGAVDHVGASIPIGHPGQRFEHRFEHTGLDPASIAPEDAVPLAVFIRQVSPLCAGARHPHHAFEIASIILCRAASAPSFSRQKRTDQRPFLVRQTNPLAQGSLQMEALNQNSIPQSTFVHERYNARPPSRTSSASAGASLTSAAGRRQGSMPTWVSAAART